MSNKASPTYYGLVDASVPDDSIIGYGHSESQPNSGRTTPGFDNMPFSFGCMMVTGIMPIQDQMAGTLIPMMGLKQRLTNEQYKMLVEDFKQDGQTPAKLDWIVRACINESYNRFVETMSELTDYESGIIMANSLPEVDLYLKNAEINDKQVFYVDLNELKLNIKAKDASIFADSITPLLNKLGVPKNICGIIQKNPNKIFDDYTNMVTSAEGTKMVSNVFGGPLLIALAMVFEAMDDGMPSCCLYEDQLYFHGGVTNGTPFSNIREVINNAGMSFQVVELQEVDFKDYRVVRADGTFLCVPREEEFQALKNTLVNEISNDNMPRAKAISLKLIYMAYQLQQPIEVWKGLSSMIPVNAIHAQYDGGTYMASENVDFSKMHDKSQEKRTYLQRQSDNVKKKAFADLKPYMTIVDTVMRRHRRHAFRHNYTTSVHDRQNDEALRQVDELVERQMKGWSDNRTGWDSIT